MTRSKPRIIRDILDVSELRYSKLAEVIRQLNGYLEDGWDGWDVSALEYYGDMTVSIELTRDRLETAEEVAARLKREDHCKEMRRKQYEDLKKEFGREK